MEHGTVVQIIEVHRDGRAVVELDGKRQEVLEMTVSDDDITPGDWVIVRAGFVLERLTDDEVSDLRRQRKQVV